MWLFIINELLDDKKIDRTSCDIYNYDGLPIVKKRSLRIIKLLRKSITNSFNLTKFLLLNTASKKKIY